MIEALDAAIPKVGTTEPWEFHSRVKEMYSWHNVAERTEVVYEKVLQLKNQPLADRLRRFYECGPVAGPCFCSVVGLDYLVWRFLEWYSPPDNVDLAVDARKLSRYHLFEEHAESLLAQSSSGNGKETDTEADANELAHYSGASLPLDLHSHSRALSPTVGLNSFHNGMRHRRKPARNGSSPKEIDDNDFSNCARASSSRHTSQVNRGIDAAAVNPLPTEFWGGRKARCSGELCDPEHSKSMHARRTNTGARRNREDARLSYSELRVSSETVQHNETPTTESNSPSLATAEDANRASQLLLAHAARAESGSIPVP